MSQLLNFENQVQVSALPAASTANKSSFAFRTSDSTMWWSNGSAWTQIGSGGGLSNGDYGGVTVGGSGAILSIDAFAFIYQRNMQNMLALY